MTSLPNKSFAKSGFGKLKPKIGLDSQPKEDHSEKNGLLNSIQQHLKSTYFELKINLEPFVSFDEMSLNQNYISQKEFNIGSIISDPPNNTLEPQNRVNPTRIEYSLCPYLPKKQELYKNVLKKLENLRNKRTNKKVDLEVFARSSDGFCLLMNRFIDEYATTGLSKKKLVNRKKAVIMDQEEGTIY